MCGILRVWDVQSGIFFALYLVPILLGIWLYRWPFAPPPARGEAVSLPEPQIAAS
jgi:hypothetical protein